MAFDRNHIQIYLWGSDQCISVMENSFGRHNFHIKNILRGQVYSPCQENILYGGADISEVDFIRDYILKTIFPGRDIRKGKRWAINDPDIYVQIPLDWEPIDPVRIIFFDPEKGCHFDLSEKEYREYATVVIRHGGYLIRGMSTTAGPRKRISKLEDI